MTTIQNGRTMKATDWIRSTDALPEERGQLCLLWANGKALLARYVSEDWGFDIEGRQECVLPHPCLWWAAVTSPEQDEK